MSSHTKNNLDVDGLALTYEKSGVGFPFIFQHGLGASSEQLRNLTPDTPRTQRFTLNVRGHADSEIGPLESISIKTFTHDLKHFVDTLSLRSSIHGGISMGAAVTLNYAVRYPENVRALVLIRPAWALEKAPSHLAIFGVISAAIDRFGPIEGKAYFETHATFQNIKFDAPANAFALLNLFDHPRATEMVPIFSRIAVDGIPIRKQDLMQLAIPTLVIGTNRDAVHPIAVAKELAENIPSAHFVKVASTSDGMEHHALEVRAAITEFLTESSVI